MMDVTADDGDRGKTDVAAEERQPRMVAGGEPRFLARIGRSNTFVIDKEPSLTQDTGKGLSTGATPTPAPRSTAPATPASRAEQSPAPKQRVAQEREQTRRRLGRRQLSLTAEHPPLVTTRGAKSLPEPPGQALEGHQLDRSGKAAASLREIAPEDAEETVPASQESAATVEAESETSTPGPDRESGLPDTADTQVTTQPEAAPVPAPVPAPRRRRLNEASQQMSGARAQADLSVRDDPGAAPQDRITNAAAADEALSKFRADTPEGVGANNSTTHPPQQEQGELQDGSAKTRFDLARSHFTQMVSANLLMKAEKMREEDPSSASAAQQGEPATASATDLEKERRRGGSKGTSPSRRRLLLRRHKTLLLEDKPVAADGANAGSVSSSPFKSASHTMSGASAPNLTARRKSSHSEKQSPTHEDIVVVAEVHFSSERTEFLRENDADGRSGLSATVEYETYAEPEEDVHVGSSQYISRQKEDEFGKASPQRKTGTGNHGHESGGRDQFQKASPPRDTDYQTQSPRSEDEPRDELKRTPPPRETASQRQSPRKEDGHGNETAKEDTGCRRESVAEETGHLETSFASEMDITCEKGRSGELKKADQQHPSIKETSLTAADVLETSLISHEETSNEDKQHREGVGVFKPHPTRKETPRLSLEALAKLQGIIRRNLEGCNFEFKSREELEQQLQKSADALREFYRARRAPRPSSELIERYENMIERCKKSRDAVLSGRQQETDVDENSQPQLSSLAESYRHVLHWLRPLGGASRVVSDDVVSYLLRPEPSTSVTI